MGHIAGEVHSYGILQKRLVQKIQGATESPLLMKILAMLFSPEQAALAGKMPHKPASLAALSQKFGIRQNELRGKLTEMARRGLVFDMEYKGQSYYVLPPVVIGLFEFTFMRVRPDIPMKELSKLFEDYFNENGHAFIHQVMEGKTQQFRALVREETVPLESQAEVLDYERAAQIISTASSVGVALCQCHHHAQHMGTACDKPQEVCLSFNFAADGLIRSGLARKITRDEGMAILLRCKEHGLAQIADNVQNKVTFMCNCCKCCCHALGGIRKCELRPGITTSNFIAEIDPAKCKGCGKCAAACPVDAITIETTSEGGRQKKHALRHDLSCLGCGVCTTVCKTNAAVMRSRPQRVLVPENLFEQRVMMAIERGKLADLIFDDPEKLSHRALGRVLGALERSAPVKSWMAAQSLNSAFLKNIVKGAKKKSGDLGKLLS